MNLDDMRRDVEELLKHDTSGHGMDHIDRVYHMAMRFARQEKADQDVVGLAALLHDVDDYKIVGIEESKKLSNARALMEKYEIDIHTQVAVLEIISTMGFSKLLEGIRPMCLEGYIVSDADMCDAMGASGIVRSVVYAVSNKGNGIIFDPGVYPNLNITLEEYNDRGYQTTHDTDSAINHVFEKMLKLHGLMLTESGRNESRVKHEFMIGFLKQYFKEQNQPEWLEFLDRYVEELDCECCDSVCCR